MKRRPDIARVREFWDRRPCNVKHSLLPVGDREYFSDVRDRKLFVEPHIKGFADYPRWRGKSVLDVGCGIGTLAVLFAKAGAHVTAVDVSPVSLELARQHMQSVGLSAQFLEADMEQLPGDLYPYEFDLVWCWGALHHTPDPERALAMLTRYMGRRSQLRLMVYHRRSWRAAEILLQNPLKVLQQGLDGAVAYASEAQAGCPVTHTFTRTSLTRLLKSVGLRSVCMFVEHIFPYDVVEYVQYVHIKKPIFEWMSLPVFRWLERHVGWHLCVIAELE